MSRNITLSARLKREQPDIVARIEAGEFKSIRAAAIAAGIIKVKTPLEMILSLLPRLTPEDHKRLRDVICNVEQQKETQFKKGNAGGPGRGKTARLKSGEPLKERDIAKKQVNLISGSPAKERDIAKKNANSLAGQLAVICKDSTR